MTDMKLLVEQLERLAAVLDEIIIMPRCAVLVRNAISLLTEQQQQIWELEDQVEYLTDKLKEQEKKGKNRLPYSPDSNVQWT